MKLKSLTKLVLAGAFALSSIGCKNKIEECNEKPKFESHYVSGIVYDKSDLGMTHDGGFFSMSFKGEDSINYSCDVIISKFFSEPDPHIIPELVKNYYEEIEKGSEVRVLKYTAFEKCGKSQKYQEFFLDDSTGNSSGLISSEELHF